MRYLFLAVMLFGGCRVDEVYVCKWVTARQRYFEEMCIYLDVENGKDRENATIDCYQLSAKVFCDKKRLK